MPLLPTINDRKSYRDYTIVYDASVLCKDVAPNEFNDLCVQAMWAMKDPPGFEKNHLKSGVGYQ